MTRSFLAACLLVALSSNMAKSEPLVEQFDVFVSGTEGYHTFRIPVLVVSTKGTVMAFCEGRKETREDFGNIHLMLKRSFDGGKTWGDLQMIYNEVEAGEKVACGNPCPVVDQDTGRIHLVFCRDNDGQFVTHSDDDGQTWSKPRDITSTCDKDDWGFYGTGPGHGLQLREGPNAGRLLIPSYHFQLKGRKGPHSHMIYSDDHGETWQLGGIVPLSKDAKPDPAGNYYAGGECSVIELGPDIVYLNTRCGRYASKCDRRTYTYSYDGGMTWEPIRADNELIAPGCHGAVLADPKRDTVLFANPGNGPDPNWDKGRKRMTVRASFDKCKSWPAWQVLHTGASSYADLALLDDGTILCLYEGGRGHRREWMRLARFTLAWLADGQEPISGAPGQ